MPDHFDILAGVYENAIKFRETEIWSKMALLPTQGKLLDIGGGTGRVARALAPFTSGVIISDLSFGMLSQGKKQSTLNQTQAAAELLPYPDDCFERVIMVDAFHHIIDPKETAQEMWRVTRPGGRIIIEEPDIRSPLIWLVAFAEKIALMRSKFIAPPKIADFFNASASRIGIYSEGHSAWILIDKLL